MTSESASRKRLLRIGVDDAPPIPLQMGDPALGTFRGFEVDLLEALAEQLDLVMEYRRAWWSLITDELVARRLDLVCSAATVTEERKAEVDFCAPHLKLQLGLVVRRDSPYPLDAAASRFGVRRGTTAEEFLREGLGLQPVTVSESNEELYAALSHGQLDAIIDDSPIAIHFANAIPGLIYRGPYENTEGEYAIMVAKDNGALKNEMNAALSRLELEGTLAKLRKRWFGSPELLVA
jgi:polar amino acid transport system substrate-binding protein